MPKFAKETTVSAEKSLGEIKTTLLRYGASKFAMMEDDSQVGVAFDMSGRTFRIIVPLPPLSEFEFKIQARTNQYGYKGQNRRSAKEMLVARSQAITSLWRVLLLVIKGKLESVDSKIETFEQAFLAHLVLPSGETMSQWVSPQIEQAYLSGKMPPLLLMSGE